MPGSHEIILTKGDGRKDVIVCAFPSVPDRTRVHAAYRVAVGYARIEDEAPTLDPNVDDVMAVCMACIGLSWGGCHLEDPPSFRGMGRDVVAYGEAVSSALFFAGYTDVEEQVEQGRNLYQAMVKHMVQAAVSATADFPRAQPPT